MAFRGITGIAVLVALTFLGSGCAFTGFRSFGPAGQASIPSDRLFDLGVADFDEDGRLDIFTVNHKFPGAWLRNVGGRFEDVTTAIGADPDPEFPGLDGLTAPAMKEPGIYLYMTDSREGEPGLLHIRTVGMPAAGKVGFLSASLRVLRAKRARIRLGKNEQSVRVVRFDARPGATIVLDPSSVADAPMAAFIEEPADPAQIKVGAEAVSPDGLDFRLTLHDRHAIAFADLVGGAEIDAFIASGGLGGGIVKSAFRGRIHDEMLSGGAGGFTEIAKGAGLDKGGCRGRQLESVDVNGDGLLDLFESCEQHPPRIYRQIEPGRFGKVRAPAATGSAERWVYLAPDQGPSLISAGDDEIDVWRRQKGGWRKVQALPARASGDVAQLAVGDVDSDGDLDVLAVAATGNTLLRNDDGRLHSVRPQSAGVPAASVAASFVDYDNDGRLDLYAVPQGLIRNIGAGGYLRTGLLETPAGGRGDRRLGRLRRRRPPRSGDRLRPRRVRVADDPAQGPQHDADPRPLARGRSARRRRQPAGDRRLGRGPGRRDARRPVGRPERRRAAFAGPLPALLGPRQPRSRRFGHRPLAERRADRDRPAPGRSADPRRAALARGGARLGQQARQRLAGDRGVRRLPELTEGGGGELQLGEPGAGLGAEPLEPAAGGAGVARVAGFGHQPAELEGIGEGDVGEVAGEDQGGGQVPDGERLPESAVVGAVGAHRTHVRTSQGVRFRRALYTRPSGGQTRGAR